MSRLQSTATIQRVFSNPFRHSVVLGIQDMVKDKKHQTVWLHYGVYAPWPFILTYELEEVWADAHATTLYRDRNMHQSVRYSAPDPRSIS